MFSGEPICETSVKELNSPMFLSQKQAKIGMV
jgi:hypothetical protein